MIQAVNCLTMGNTFTNKAMETKNNTNVNFKALPKIGLERGLFTLASIGSFIGAGLSFVQHHFKSDAEAFLPKGVSQFLLNPIGDSCGTLWLLALGVVTMLGAILFSPHHKDAGGLPHGAGTDL